MRPDQTLVLGLGNILLRDDGAGVHALRRFRERISHGELAVEVGVNPLAATHLLAAARRIIVFDALLAGAPPGTVSVLPMEDLRDSGVHGSLHELGLIQALRLVRADQPPVTLVAVEPAVIDYGLDLSPPVAAALPAMVAAAAAAIASAPATPSGSGAGSWPGR